MLSSSFKRVNKKHNNIKDQLIVLFMKNRLMFQDSDMMRSNEKSRRRDRTKQISVTTKGIRLSYELHHKSSVTDDRNCEPINDVHFHVRPCLTKSNAIKNQLMPKKYWSC